MDLLHQVSFVFFCLLFRTYLYHYIEAGIIRNYREFLTFCMVLDHRAVQMILR